MNKAILIIIFTLFSCFSRSDEPSFKQSYKIKGSILDRPELRLSKKILASKVDIDQIIESLKSTNKKIKILGRFGEKRCLELMSYIEENDNFLIDEKSAKKIKLKTKIKVDGDLIEKITPKLVVLKERNGDFIALGLWSKNLTTWNLLKMKFNSISGDRLNSSIRFSKDFANVDLDYLLKVNNSNEIKFSVYQKLDHNIFDPRKFTSGGRITYRHKFNRVNFDFFLFGQHENNF